jgi:hypothetical protein
MQMEGKMTEISIKTPEELNRLFDALGDEIVEANFYHRILCNLLDCLGDYEREFAQSNTFWYLVFEAFHDARLTHLSRVYDKSQDSLNLARLLDTIKDHCKVPVDQAQLSKDMKAVRKENPLVKELIGWRNAFVAHRDADKSKSLQGTKALEQASRHRQKIETLLDRSFEIFNRYSSLYRNSTNSRQIVGHDDYKSLLELVRLGLQKRDEERRTI